jgi:enoyl-CoA hydratase/carnithine racemase
MAQRNTLAHALHDIGLAAWFGGSLMGAIGVNGAAADVDDPRQRARVANAGWNRWTPFNLLAIGAHLAGGAMLLKENKGRVAAQKGVLANTNVKLGLTAGALGATAYARMLGKKMSAAGDVPVEGGTDATLTTPPEVAKAQKQLSALQWAIPGLTGAMLASSSLHEEQQRTTEALKGSVLGIPAKAGTAVGTAALGAATAAKHKVQDIA